MSAAPVLNTPRSELPAKRRTALQARSWRALAWALGPLLLTPVVLLVHGYHPFANDAGLYVAGIRRALDPSLYPLNAAFVTALARHSIFAVAMAGVVRISHLPLESILFMAHLVSIVLFLTACRQLAVRIFDGRRERWCALVLACACFTLPVAGTALFVMDPYVTARSFSTPLSLMAVAASLDRAWLRTAILLALTALFHPLMGAYAVAFIVLQRLISAEHLRPALALCGATLLAAALAFAFAHRMPISNAYRLAVSLPERRFLFLARWRWYEWLGLALPTGLLAAAARRLGTRSLPGALCLTCLCFGSTGLLIAAFLAPVSGPYLLVPIQVLRTFQLVYILGIVLCGGILARPMSRSRLAALALFVTLFAGMAIAQRISWSGSAQVEWPGSIPENPYQQAFVWIRDHTPRSAVFAFNPRLVYTPGEDEEGFRAIAERDQLADDKDAGVVAVAPGLADRWAAQRNAALDVDRMTDAERMARLKPYGANWLLLQPGAETHLPCIYRNRVVVVCQMPGSSER